MSELESKEGLHYPLYVTSPSKIDITVEQFRKLSYYGMATLWCAWKYLFEKTDTGYSIWTQEWRAQQWVGHPRFKDCKMWKIPRVEMGRIDVPNEHPLISWIEKHCQHLIMK